MKAATKLTTRLQNIKTSMQLYQFCVGDGSRNVRHIRAIHVQSKSVGRRREGASRGSARRRSGRPLAAVAGQKHLTLKRHRSISANVSANRPNARSHGDAH